MNLNTLVPKFLQRIDDRLLKNKPAAWSSRVHHVVFFSIMVSMVFFILLLFINRDPREESTQFTWIILMTILIIIAIVIFLIYLFRFNVLKRFGKWNSKDSLLSFLFYFLSFTCIYFWAFIPSVTESIPANCKYSFRELSEDQNQINKAIALIEKDSIDLRVTKGDTISLITDKKMYSRTERRNGYAVLVSNEINDGPVIADSVEVAAVEDEEDVEDVEYQEKKVKRHIRYVDSLNFYSLIKSNDSIVLINDTSFLEYNIPTFHFCSNFNSYGNYEYEDETDENSNGHAEFNRNKWPDIKMYHVIMNEVQNPDQQKYLKIIHDIQSKYLIGSDKAEPYTSYRQFRIDYNYGSNATYAEFVSRKYFCNKIEKRIGNILDRKTQWDEGNTVMKLHIWYYLALTSSLFLWLFRHNTKKSFFLSFLVAGLLFLVTSILMILLEYEEQGIYVTLLFYFLLFLGFALTIFRIRIQKILPAIAANFVALITPFIPMYMVHSYFYIQRVTLTKLDQRYYDYLWEREWGFILISEYVGFILLLLLVYVLYSKLYKKWIALPEE